MLQFHFQYDLQMEYQLLFVEEIQIILVLQHQIINQFLVDLMIVEKFDHLKGNGQKKIGQNKICAINNILHLFYTKNVLFICGMSKISNNKNTILNFLHFRFFPQKQRKRTKKKLGFSEKYLTE